MNDLRLIRLAEPNQRKLAYTRLATPWYKARNAEPSPLPEISWLVEDEEGLPVALGGLIKTDSDFAIIDGYVASPKVSSELRHRALGLISLSCIKTAKELGFERCLCMSRVPSIIEHGKMMKAREDFEGYKIIAIHLSDWSF